MTGLIASAFSRLLTGGADNNTSSEVGARIYFLAASAATWRPSLNRAPT